MARIRSGNKPGPVPVRKLAAKKKEPSGNNSAAQPGPHPMQGVVEFPKRPPVEEVVSERIFFEVAPLDSPSSGPQRLSGCRRRDRSWSNRSSH